MLNNIHKFFDNFNTLFYWLLILTTWLLAGDISGNLFLNKPLSIILETLKIDDLLVIFVSQIVFILTSLIIYEIIKITALFISKNSPENTKDDISRQYMSYDELINTAVKNNNQTMYNYSKDFQNEIKHFQNQKHLCFTIILLIIISLFLEKSIINIISENFNNYSFSKRSFLSLIIVFDLLGLLFFFTKNMKISVIRRKNQDSSGFDKL
ncbi:hypothetical protein NLG42_04590 [Flavobacterium plurextorum]|uniref:hypothetical protein n=1 Tax=Flavobacterium TaxID=237 RepID=UPI000C18C3D6|nr:MULTISPECIES: hypothetical protein [Flavobacterium]PIF69796.1 hypothetical protein CLU99_0511 [Flavobacterium sp. 2]UUW10081.1 hypothetical protein NLG42_04590 [Flavobacterium plurextorum]